MAEYQEESLFPELDEMLHGGVSSSQLTDGSEEQLGSLDMNLGFLEEDETYMQLTSPEMLRTAAQQDIFNYELLDPIETEVKDVDLAIPVDLAMPVTMTTDNVDLSLSLIMTDQYGYSMVGGYQWNEEGNDEEENDGSNHLSSEGVEIPECYSPLETSVTSSSEINDEELVNLSVKDLNERLRIFPKEDAEKMKKRRRQLKNRHYAQTCRSRRVMGKAELQTENEKLKQKVAMLQKQISMMVVERDSYKAKLDVLETILSS